MQEQVAQISLHLGLGNRRCFHAGVELQLFFEMTYLKRITALVYVFAQFLFHALDSRLKSLLKRLFHRNTCSDEIYKLAELSPPLSILGKNAQRRTQLSKFVDLIGASVPMEQAFQQAFQTTVESMEKELREYINQSRYSFEVGHFEKKLELDTSMEAAPISEAEVQAYLGDLLLHSNRSDSEAYLQKALAIDPNLAMANASLGMLRVREGKTDEALESLERAVAANSRNYLIHYYYAYALSRKGVGHAALVTGFAPGTVTKIREELKKAIELRPDYPESYNLLAFVNLVSGTDLDASIEMLTRALRISPGRNDFTFTLAQVYMRKQDYKTARQI